jgi:hypothetical protein
MPAPRSPDYYLKVMNKATGQKSGRLGAGWVNEDGSINFVLDPCVVLDSKDQNLELRLFPSEKK